MRTWDEALLEAAETLAWIEDWRAGQFTPAHTEDGWSVEMHGLVDSSEKIAKALLEAPTRLAAARSGVLTVLAALDALVADGIAYEDARKLIDDMREAGKQISEAHRLRSELPPRPDRIICDSGFASRAWCWLRRRA